ncbi:type II secretion system F family protein [Atopobiaceae bacterium 24-176]
MAFLLGMTAVLAFAAALCLVPGRPRLAPRVRLGRLLARVGSSAAVRGVFEAPWLPKGLAVAAERAAASGQVRGIDGGRGAVVLAGPVTGVAGALVSMDAGGAFLGLCLGWGVVAAWGGAEGRRLSQEEMRAVPDAYRSLAGGLASGQTMAQAMTYVGRHGRGTVGRAFLKGSFELDCGSSVADALEVVAAGVGDPSMGLLSCALTISQRTGAPMAGLLERSAALVEEREGLQGLLRTKTAQVRLSAAVVMVLPVLLVASLALLSPDFRAGCATPVGAGCLAVAAALDIVAFGVMKKIMAGVEP